MTSSNDDDNPFAGFEEFIQDHDITIHKKTSADRTDEGQITSFLENNYHRLQKTTQLFQKKLPMLEKYDQSSKVIRDLKRQKEDYKNQLIDKFIAEDSLLNNSLEIIFNSHFKEIDKD